MQIFKCFQELPCKMKKWLILLTLIFLTACSSQLDIPYHQQEGPSCVQSQMLMAIKYYNPNSELTQQDLDQRTGRQQNQWTWLEKPLMSGQLMVEQS